MLIGWISLDFKETGVISIAFSNVYIHWHLATPGKINRRITISLILKNEGPLWVPVTYLKIPGRGWIFKLLSNTWAFSPNSALCAAPFRIAHHCQEGNRTYEKQGQSKIGTIRVRRRQWRRKPPPKMKGARTSATIDNISPVTTPYGIYQGLCSLHYWCLLSFWFDVYQNDRSK